MPWISIGRSRKDIKWKAIEITWKDLVDRLKKPVITSETINEYLKMSKDKQGEIKDQGGYVGGIIAGGNRLAKNVKFRSLVTLDIDNPSDAFWEDYVMAYDYASVLHATHSSAPGHLRYRLIIPLDRDCHTDEYEAIARKIAGQLNIEQFDSTTFQPERLMFWPSVSKNMDYFIQEQVGPEACVDDILAEYQDWTDMSQWPMHEKVDKLIRKELSKQEDPLEKEGPIGAFCRTYTITEVIEKYLDDTYIPTAESNRWTYANGSTTGGLVIYDDKFAYSHHNTDPCGLKLVNAFDMLRLSKYADLDTKADDRTNTTKLPSYIKAIELVLKDKKVKKNIITEKLQDAQEEFGDYETDELEWTKKLDVDKKGNCMSTTQNVVVILENDPKLKDKFRWDEFNHRMSITADLQWKKIKRISDSWLSDSDLAHLRHYFETVYQINTIKKIEDALTVVGMRKSFHPIVDYLKQLKWDGTERLDTMLVDYLGADDSNYTREVTRKTMVAAVARVYEPGTKFDNVLILVGKQGIGKSQLINRLGGMWYSDTFGDLKHSKDSMEQLHGVWIMEMGELAGMKKAELETIKLFIAKSEDRFRVAFGQMQSVFPRQCIFIGTTNEDEFLQDPTGNRRFWPVVCDSKLVDKSTFDIDSKLRDQLWAEAVFQYELGEELFLNAETRIQAEMVQDMHTEQEAHFDVIREYLNTEVPENWYELDQYDKRAFLKGNKGISDEPLMLRNKITIREIWVEAIDGKLDQFNKFVAKSIRNSMRKMPGWEYKVISFRGLKERGYIKETHNLVTK